VLWNLPTIKLAPDVIFTIFGFPVTNTLLCTWISIAVLVIFFFFATRRLDLIPRGVQNLAEWAVEGLLNLAQGVAGKEKGKKFFPLAATFFIFILVSNLLDVFPGVDTIGTIDTEMLDKLHIHATGPFLFGPASNAVIPWIRPATTDLNLTIAMALIAVITAQVFGFYTLGFGGHAGKYINIKSLLKFNFEGFIEFFVGILEIISEIGRVLSLAFRLFGNIFAGSVVLAVFAFILPFVSNIIFIPFVLFVAFVQAFVFSLLTLIYLQVATTSHEHAEEEMHEQETIEAKQRDETVATH
jgi:F-type H+-transporting ATPase subunit a